MSDEPRRFEDAHGDGWEIRPATDYKWHFVPLVDDEAIRKIVAPPPQTDDPFDLSDQELRRLLDSGIPTEGITEPAGTAGG